MRCRWCSRCRRCRTRSRRGRRRGGPGTPGPTSRGSRGPGSAGPAGCRPGGRCRDEGDRPGGVRPRRLDGEIEHERRLSGGLARHSGRWQDARNRKGLRGGVAPDSAEPWLLWPTGSWWRTLRQRRRDHLADRGHGNRHGTAHQRRPPAHERPLRPGDGDRHGWQLVEPRGHGSTADLPVAPALRDRCAGPLRQTAAVAVDVRWPVPNPKPTTPGRPPRWPGSSPYLFTRSPLGGSGGVDGIASCDGPASGAATVIPSCEILLPALMRRLHVRNREEIRCSFHVCRLAPGLRLRRRTGASAGQLSKEKA